MSNFESDLNQESILSEYLDSIYNSKNLDFERISDINKQHKGIDIIIKHKSKEYIIDEKAQLHYLNADLPTFTFELSYLNNEDELKKGWLFDDNKLTMYYFLITGMFLKGDKKILISSDDFKKLKITSVNRQKLIYHLESIGLNESKLMEYDNELRTNNNFGRYSIEELNPEKEGLLFFTEHLSEKPMNLQLRLSYLINKEVAKRFH